MRAGSEHERHRGWVVLGLGIALHVAGCKTTEPPAPPGLQFVRVDATEPSPGGRSPALVLLHGVGANERDLLGLVQGLDPRFSVFSLRAPLPRGPDGYGWYTLTFTPEGLVHDASGAEAARVQVVRFLRELRLRPDVDPDRIFLLGFSQGTIVSLSIALSEPGLLRGVVAISGRVLPEVSAHAHAASPRPKILLLHGLDDQTLPYANATVANALLTSAGFEVDLRSYPAGHEITGPMRSELLAWLEMEAGAGP